LRDLFTFSSKVIKKAHNNIKERLNVKKRARNLCKKGKKESLDCELVWTWTTICIYKKQGKKI
jgi:hypothetical protein